MRVNIVDDLRDWSEGPDTHQLTEDAADEISRCRARVVHMEEWLSAMAAICDDPDFTSMAKVQAVRWIVRRALGDQGGGA